MRSVPLFGPISVCWNPALTSSHPHRTPPQFTQPHSIASLHFTLPIFKPLHFISPHPSLPSFYYYCIGNPCRSLDWGLRRIGLPCRLAGGASTHWPSPSNPQFTHRNMATLKEECNKLFHGEDLVINESAFPQSVLCQSIFVSAWWFIQHLKRRNIWTRFC